LISIYDEMSRNSSGEWRCWLAVLLSYLWAGRVAAGPTGNGEGSLFTNGF